MIKGERYCRQKALLQNILQPLLGNARSVKEPEDQSFIALEPLLIFLQTLLKSWAFYPFCLDADYNSFSRFVF